MIRSLACISCCVVLIASHHSLADECFHVSNLNGYAAYADQQYTFSKEGIQSIEIVCIGNKSGYVNSTDVELVKLGNSTLIGYGSDGQANEMVEIYQIDRKNNKLLYTKSRIGTKTVMPLFSDTVMSCVGDIRPTE